MAMLTVAGFEVFILPGTQIQDVKHGDVGRAYSGRMRSDVVASHRAGRIVGSYYDTANDAGALRAILNTPGPVLIGGTLIGDDAYFHVANLTVTPITADRLKFDFDIAETDDSPSELLFTLHGDALGSYTFTRSGAVGKYTGADGVLADQSANIPRQEWEWSDATEPYPDTPWLLLESPAFTNLVTSDDLTAWTQVGTGVSAGGVSDPAGGTGAYTITDNDNVSNERVYRQTATIVGSEACLVGVVRERSMPASGNQSLILYDSDAALNRIILFITSWSNGEPQITASAGTHLGSRYVGNGYWAVYGYSNAIIGSNAHQAHIEPANTPTSEGAIDVYRVNVFDAASPPWSILDASETKNAETFYATFSPVPQAMCGMVHFRELEQPSFGGYDRIVHIGDSSNNAPNLHVSRVSATDQYYVEHYNAAASFINSSIDINPAWGDEVQLAWWLYADGSVNIAGRTRALGSSTWSAWTTGSQSAALALASAWSDTRLYLGSVGATGRGSQAFHSAIVLRGTSYTTTYMLDWVRARLNARDVLASL